MSTSKRLYWIAQFIGWTSYASLIFLASYADDPKQIDAIFITNIVSLIIFGIVWTHTMRFAFFKLDWLDLRLPPLIPRVLISSLICSILIAGSTTFLSLMIDVKENENLTTLNVIINVFAVLVLILFWNSIYFTFHFFQKSRKQELNNLSLESSRNEIELKNLRSQLNPHFLFNSLNSIRALIDIEPSKAKVSVTTLSNLLRKSLILGRENLVRLDEELEMVSNYLELEKIRFEERLDVKMTLDAEINDFMLPPFSLQMLVENAIKHGISNLVDGGEIIIETKKIAGKITISVTNSGEIVDESNVEKGIGIENTKRRLALQFKDSAEFELTQSGNNVIAQLIFKTQN